MKDYFSTCKTEEEAKKVYRELSKKMHPDKGGTKEAMSNLNKQYEEAKKRLNKYSESESIYNNWRESFNNKKEKPLHEQAQENFRQKYTYSNSYRPFGSFGNTQQSNENILISQLRARVETLEQAYRDLDNRYNYLSSYYLKECKALYDRLKMSIKEVNESINVNSLLRKENDDLNKTISELIKDNKRIDKEREIAIIDKMTLWEFLRDKINRWIE